MVGITVMIVFSKEWFEYYQSKLLWFANTRYGRWVLRIHGNRSDVGKNKITKIEPHAITWKENGQYKTEFRTHAKFSKRLYYGLKPLWHLIHLWDIQIANRLNTALNLGFDTLIFYPDAHPETSSVDGYIYKSGSDVTFATIRSSSGTARDDSGTALNVKLVAGGTTDRFAQMQRAFVLFDTASLPSNSIVTDAYVDIYSNGFKYNYLGETTLDIVSSNPASNTALSISDYSSIGSTSFGSISYSNFQSGYNRFTLNASGISNVSIGGVSKFALTLGWDVAASFTGTWSAYQYTQYTMQSKEYLGTSNDPRLTVGYNILPFAIYSNSNPYASGSMKYNSGSGWTSVSSGDLYFVTYTTTGATTVAYNSQDPSDILRAVIDNYNNYGGTVTYDGTSIDDTGTTVSYTFNTQTTLECVNKILELCPVGWYWYIDPATNLIHLHQKSSTADHRLALEKDIRYLKPEKRIEGIINTVYFTGGDTGGGTLLYKKYQNQYSFNLYGSKSIKYVDGRVTLSATADTISNRILQDNASPEIRITVEVADSNAQTGAYDIESINIGDVINIVNIKGNTGGSLWDVAFWDQDKWDYNISQIGSMYIQIVRKEYTPDSVRLICSTVPPDISKRIEDINRNLQATQTQNNPSAPS